METIATTALVVQAVALSLFLGKLLPLHLPGVSRVFNRKPFSCRPCLTFHFTWGLVGVVALATGSLVLFGVGWVIAFVVFCIVRYIDNKQIID